MEIFLYKFFSSKIAIYLSLGVPKEHPSYKRSLQSSKENIQHLKHDPDLDPATQFNADPDPQTWFKGLKSILKSVHLMRVEYRESLAVAPARSSCTPAAATGAAA